MRLKAWLPLLLSMAATAAAQDKKNAQDGLTPTDVLHTLRVTADARLQASLGQGTLEIGPASEDVDLKEFSVLFQAAVGLGMNFEVEASLPVAFTSEFEVDAAAGTEFRVEEQGLGDLTLGVNYAILRDNGDDPQLLIGAFVVLPTGDDDPAEAEIVVNNVVQQAGDEGGIGDGAFSYGFQIGLSKRFSNLEPYFLFRYLVGGDSDVDNVETDHADVATLLVGLEIHAGDQATVDLRAVLSMNSGEVDKLANGTEETEEAHLSYGFQGRVYLSLGGQVALVAGVGIIAVEDHALIEESPAAFELSDTWVFGAEFGLQISFGK